MRERVVWVTFTTCADKSVKSADKNRKSADKTQNIADKLFTAKKSAWKGVFLRCYPIKLKG